MSVELSNQLGDRLQNLLQAAKHDFESVRSIPDAEDVFQPLFDALQSTLQNMDASGAETKDSL